MSDHENSPIPPPRDPLAGLADDSFRIKTPEEDQQLRQTFRGAQPPPMDTKGIYEGAETVLVGDVRLTQMEVRGFETLSLVVRPQMTSGFHGHVFVIDLNKIVATRVRDQLSAGIRALDPEMRAKMEKDLRAQGRVEWRKDEKTEPVVFTHIEGYRPVEDAFSSANAPEPLAQESQDLRGKVPRNADAPHHERGRKKRGFLDRLRKVAHHALDAAAAAVGGEREDR